jgi:ABC-2 type transport system permease protein
MAVRPQVTGLAVRGAGFGAYFAIARAGFRRYATYRQAMVAAIFTNTVFGFLRGAVLGAVVGASGALVTGYDPARLATFVWVGQGLIGVVLLWAPTDMAERIRTGDVLTDLLRPIDPVWHALASDVGRAGFAALTRFVAPVVVGALAFELHAPRRLATYPLFALSVVLATLVCFGCRYLVNAAAYWLLDARGPLLAWTLLSGVLGGLYFPIWFLPHDAALILVTATPFPSVIQLPLDVITERGSALEQAGCVALQAVWAAVMLALARAVQARGERKLVVQGG